MGVTVYVADCEVFIGFIKVPVTLFCTVPVAPPVNPPVTVGSNQLYCVPAGTEPIALALNVSPLHTILN